jgi:hypothetical protein
MITKPRNIHRLAWIQFFLFHFFPPQLALPTQLYGYDRARFDDATTLNDTTRNDATHDTLPTPTTTHTPNVQRNAD